MARSGAQTISTELHFTLSIFGLNSSQFGFLLCWLKSQKDFLFLTVANNFILQFIFSAFYPTILISVLN